jgi:malonyl CoA-acyl carrier protein transacylase
MIRRVLAVLALAAAAAVALAGCARFDAALGKRVAVVYFRAGTSQSSMMKVRGACAKVPGVTPEALPATVNPTRDVYDVRFVVSHASDADIAKLEQCLQRFPAVQGVSVTDVGEEGG